MNLEYYGALSGTAATLQLLEITPWTLACCRNFSSKRQLIGTLKPLDRTRTLLLLYRSRIGTTTARSISLKSSLIHHLMHHGFAQAQDGRFGWTDRRVPYQDAETEACPPGAVCVDPASVQHKLQP